jgi:hypothetical protein
MSIPIRIGIPSGSEDRRPRFVVSVSDVLQRSLYNHLQEAENEYLKSATAWHALANQLRQAPSDPIPRLELGASFDKFFAELVSKHDFEVTNQIEALTRELGIRKSALDYIRRASRKFRAKELRGRGLVWMQVQEMTDIKDPVKARECMKLVLDGRIQSQEQVRAFKRAANQSRK